MICDKCKKFFMAGNRPSGIPNGVKMILENGKAITLCSDCVMALGSMEDEKDKDEFLNSLGAENKPN